MSICVYEKYVSGGWALCIFFFGVKQRTRKFTFQPTQSLCLSIARDFIHKIANGRKIISLCVRYLQIRNRMALGIWHLSHATHSFIHAAHLYIYIKTKAAPSAVVPAMCIYAIWILKQ